MAEYTVPTITDLRASEGYQHYVYLDWTFSSIYDVEFKIYRFAEAEPSHLVGSLYVGASAGATSHVFGHSDFENTSGDTKVYSYYVVPIVFVKPPGTLAAAPAAGTMSNIDTGYVMAGGNDADNTIFGGPSDNTVVGNDGSDRLFGLGDRDVLYGGKGADHLDGGEGNDRLSGDQGHDTLIGGPGADRFVYGLEEEAGKDADGDTVYFVRSEGDLIDLRYVDATLKTKDGNKSFEWVDDEHIGAAFTGEPGQLRYKGHVLEADRDGDGRADFSIRIIGKLTADDVLL
ncbi:MAG TPA: hypothetical protein VHL98_10930 [Microvirga sp.]|nr:hypothetical protein [Microvirga sp.]